MLRNDSKRRAEHEAVRTGVGYYDFTHQMVDARGEDVAEFLDTIFVNSIADTNIGNGVYTTVLNEEAEIVDDLILFRMDFDHYWISTLYADEMIELLDKHKGDYDVEYKEITDELSMFALQGPKSPLVLNQILNKPVKNRKFFTIFENSIGDVDVHIARADFTGEYGYEIYIHPDHTDMLREKLNEAGAAYDIVELSTDVVLKSLPVEKGFVLMSDLKDLTPVEALFEWTVDYDTDFIGKQALLEKVADRNKLRLRGYRIIDWDEDVEITEGEATVNYQGKEVGYVTSFTYGYTVEGYIGYAVVDTSKIARNLPVTIKSGGKEYKALTQDRVFYDTDDTRRTTYLVDGE